MIIIFALITLIYNIPVEFCEKFDVFYDMSTCTGNYEYCPNQGTWDCHEFICFDYNDDNREFCLGGVTMPHKCANLVNMKYVDLWVHIDDNPSYDMQFFLMSYQIYIDSNHVYFNGSTFEDVYDFPGPGVLTHFAFTLDYENDYNTHTTIIIQQRAQC